MNLLKLHCCHCQRCKWSYNSCCYCFYCHELYPFVIWSSFV